WSFAPCASLLRRSPQDCGNPRPTIRRGYPLYPSRLSCRLCDILGKDVRERLQALVLSTFRAVSGTVSDLRGRV
ncbi:MAG TPA: hypothetical protein VE965_05420, partial [Gammaproteobacteria bacterium]|nr:hypothetical protein [Gammaproteobacteria bacterium]